jgi:hypothetical protein
MLLTNKRYLTVGGIVLLLAGIIGATAVTLDQGQASDQSRPGDHFEAIVCEPIVIDAPP